MPTYVRQNVTRQYNYEAFDNCNQKDPFILPTTITITAAYTQVTRDSNRADRPAIALFSDGNGDTAMEIYKRYVSSSQISDSAKKRCGPEGFVDQGGYAGITVLNRLANSTGPVAAALAKLTGSRVNLGTSFADIHLTMSMVGKRIAQAAELFGAIKAADQVRLDDILRKITNQYSASEPGLHAGRPMSSIEKLSFEKRLSGTYLEYAYGWKPLAQDIFDLIDGLHQDMATKGSKVRVVAGLSPAMRKALKKPGWVPEVTPRVDGSKFCIRPSLKVLEEFRDPSSLANYCVYNGVVVNPTLRTLNEYGLVNPAQIAWERVPFSFVADWFLGIQDSLGAMTGELGLRTRGCSLITERRVVYAFKSGRISSVEQTINRIPVVAAAALIPSWKLGWLTDPSMTRIANATSVFSQSTLRPQRRVLPADSPIRERSYLPLNY